MPATICQWHFQSQLIFNSSPPSITVLPVSAHRTSLCQHQNTTFEIPRTGGIFCSEKDIEISISECYKLVQQCIDENDSDRGQELQLRVAECGLESSAFIGSHIVRMFASFDSLVEATEAFMKIAYPSVFSWSAIISAHAKLGYHYEAIELYEQMQNVGVYPDGHVFVSVIQACTHIGDFKKGQIIHADIVERGSESQLFVGNTLLSLYVVCESLYDVCILFERLPERDTATWNVLIGGYGKHGHPDKALNLFEQMSEQGTVPNKISHICCLKVLANNCAVELGRKAHAGMVIHGFEVTSDAVHAIIAFYVQCEILYDAHAIFDRYSQRDMKTWETVIMAYVQKGLSKEALNLFKCMQQERNDFTIGLIVCALGACADIPDLEEVQMIHALVIQLGFMTEMYIGNALVDAYAKCGSLANAQVMFECMPYQDTVTWSALITGYTHHGLNQNSMEAYDKMQENNVLPNQVTFTCVLRACSCASALEKGILVHTQVIAGGFEHDANVASALIDFYARCHNLEDALIVFDKLQERDAVHWNIVISGYTRCHCGQEALRYFEQMQDEGVEFSTVTIVEVLKACSIVLALEQAKQIHMLMVQKGVEGDLFVGTALIDTYSNCGCLCESHAVFTSLERRDVVTWSTMIGVLAQHNDYKGAMHAFECMQQEGFRPNDVTFSCLLSACAQSLLVNEGCLHFQSMKENYCVSPALEHYCSLANMLGCVGCVSEAEDLLESTPFCTTAVGWMSLLYSCKMYGSLSLGRRCLNNLVKLDPKDNSGYGTLVDIFLGAGLLEQAKRVNEHSKKIGGWKKPARALIEVQNGLHEFVVGDKSHYLSDDIYAKLNQLSNIIKEEGLEQKEVWVSVRE